MLCGVMKDRLLALTTVCSAGAVGRAQLASILRGRKKGTRTEPRSGDRAGAPIGQWRVRFAWEIGMRLYETRCGGEIARKS